MDWVKLLAKFGIICFCIMGLQGCSIPMSEIGKQAFETSYVQLECPYPKEPTPKNSDNKVPEGSRAELDESDEEALKRIISTGTIQSFQNFKESYPKSKYIQEVSDWTQWLEKWKGPIRVHRLHFIPGTWVTLLYDCRSCWYPVYNILDPIDLLKEPADQNIIKVYVMYTIFYLFKANIFFH